MAGRYSLSHSKERLENRFSVKMVEKWKPRYNAASLQDMPIITNANPKEFSIFRWGFIPNWAPDESYATNLINARAENVMTKAPFREAIKFQRCLVPADGYFEWKKEGKNRIPYRITLNSDEAFAFAGIWDSWVRPNDGEVINTFAILTVRANELVKEIHDRMPLIIPKSLETSWINNALNRAELEMLMKPYDGDQMNFYKVNKIVNSTDYDTPECIQVAPKIYPGETFSLFD
jgi:putative SOS response-associated peptidase YedK